MNAMPLGEQPRYDSPIEMLRHAVDCFDHCVEDVISDWTIPELFNIYCCWMRCGFDYYPDEWTDRQLAEAKKGVCPEWDDRGTPVYAKDRLTVRKITAITIKEVRSVVRANKKGGAGDVR
jgi:hypothetical protein